MQAFNIMWKTSLEIRAYVATPSFSPLISLSLVLNFREQNDLNSEFSNPTVARTLKLTIPIFSHRS